MAVIVMRMAVIVVAGLRFPAGRDLPVLMSVLPQLGLVEQKEKNQPDQQSGKQVVGAGLAFEGFGQQVHEGGGQQRTGGQAEHALGVARQHAKAEQRRQPHAAAASGQGPLKIAIKIIASHARIDWARAKK